MIEHYPLLFFGRELLNNRVGTESSLHIFTVGLLANKSRQWKSMLTHQEWFYLVYNIPSLVSQTTEFVICIVFISMTPYRHITSPFDESRPETWPGNYMGKATQVWQLTLSNHRRLKFGL